MQKIAIAKFVSNVIVGMGTTKVVKDIIKNNVQCETKIDKFVVWTAAVAIGGLASDATKARTSAKIDAVIALLNKTEETVEEPPAETAE